MKKWTLCWVQQAEDRGYGPSDCESQMRAQYVRVTRAECQGWEVLGEAAVWDHTRGRPWMPISAGAIRSKELTDVLMIICRRERGGCVSKVSGPRKPCREKAFAAVLWGPGVWTEHWRWDEEEGKHLKIVKLTRKRVVEHKRKQKEILRFLALVYGSYKGKH